MLAGAFGVLIVAELAVGFLHHDGRLYQALGFDFTTYRDAAARWLAGGGFYEPYQLAGPYDVRAREIMYPPTILALLVPFLVLPAVPWWAVPLAVIGWRIHHVRGPRLVAVLFLLAMPWTLDLIANGNPGMWMAAFLALPWRPAAALVLMKPILAPFALAGAGSRWWWLIAAVLVAGALVPDYLAVIANARFPGSTPLYSLTNVPLLLIPLIAKHSKQDARHGLSRVEQLAVAIRSRLRHELVA